MSKRFTNVLLLLLFVVIAHSSSLDESDTGILELVPSTSKITATQDEIQTVNIAVRGEIQGDLLVGLKTDSETPRVELSTNLLVFNSSVSEQSFTVKGVSVGAVNILVVSNETNAAKFQSFFIRVQIELAHWLEILVTVVGWIYFVSWSLCYYPQIIKNFQRRSVVGLSFDFQFTSTSGHISYAVFNCCMFWSSTIKNLYSEKHPTGVNPVLVNDVIFSLHATVVNILLVLQCCFFEKGDQKISRIYKALLVGFVITIVICGILTGVNVMDWLDYVYMFSYIKLVVTLTKYGPQVYMNYRKQSTSGFSIIYAMLDLSGGSLSVIQMFLLSWNNNDWENISGNLSKLGLGLFTIVFDTVFLIQHYVLYGDKSSVDDSANKVHPIDVEKSISSRRSSIFMLFSQNIEDSNYTNYHSTDNLVPEKY